jgi:hypothetical protein
LIRVLFFLILAVLLAATQGVAAVCTWTGLALLLWSMYRARDEWLAVWGAARRLDRNAGTS